MSALEVSRREQAAWRTRELVREVAATAFHAIQRWEPIEGFHDLSRPVLDDPLAGVRAGRLVSDVAAGQLREWALRARGAGRSWDEVGEALELPAALEGGTRAEAAWEWLVEHRPPSPSREPGRPGSAVWTCTTCRGRVRDTGPFASHPDDRETGHHETAPDGPPRCRHGTAKWKKAPMPSRRRRTTVLATALRQTAPLLLGTELVRADVALSVLGLALGDVPVGGPVTWALFVDAVLVGRTDEPMTDEAAKGWARRMLGDGVRFQLGHRDGGYWLADAAGVDRFGAGGWSR